MTNLPQNFRLDMTLTGVPVIIDEQGRWIAWPDLKKPYRYVVEPYDHSPADCTAALAHLMEQKR